MPQNCIKLSIEIETKGRAKENELTTPFTKSVIAIIQSIPPGMVSTYGIVALYANNPYGARQVSRILHSSSRKYKLPWHRVVNRNGRISLPPGGGYELQKRLLEEEGVVFEKGDLIDLDVYLWWPEEK